MGTAPYAHSRHCHEKRQSVLSTVLSITRLNEDVLLAPGQISFDSCIHSLVSELRRLAARTLLHACKEKSRYITTRKPIKHEQEDALLIFLFALYPGILPLFYSEWHTAARCCARHPRLRPRKKTSGTQRTQQKHTQESNMTCWASLSPNIPHPASAWTWSTHKY